MERRYAAFDLLDLRVQSENDTGPGTFVGHAAVFNQRTLIGSKRWGFVEQLAPTAFNDVLTDDVRFLLNHDPSLLMGRTTSKTLRLSTDKTGLGSENDMPDTQLGRDTTLLIKRGDLTQMSFAFSMDGGEELVRTLPEDDKQYPGMEERTITKVGRLYDVSPVTYPAYEGTDAGMRLHVPDDVVRRFFEAHDLDPVEIKQRCDTLLNQQMRHAEAAARLVGVPQ